ncbi:hypothetical protein SCLCIDRAFT_1220234 [Scleroderma citrinum Foug A]|uniref:Uncharacterized protein n=1 Tax=Scleroderma citrinum Foug A TaxID=1036808 RepID=A0A0C2Z3Q7_9AGAM|nr:hypothetical protein SCLCIDRAFT_1220234 [Scleroderma citrinum Foug A]
MASSRRLVLSMKLEISAVHKPRHIGNRAKHATSPAWTRFDKGTSTQREKEGSQSKAVQSGHQVTPEGAGEEGIHCRMSTHKTYNRKPTQERWRGPKDDGLLTRVDRSTSFN